MTRGRNSRSQNHFLRPGDVVHDDLPFDAEMVRVRVHLAENGHETHKSLVRARTVPVQAPLKGHGMFYLPDGMEVKLVEVLQPIQTGAPATTKLQHITHTEMRMYDPIEEALANKRKGIPT